MRLATAEAVGQAPPTHQPVIALPIVAEEAEEAERSKARSEHNAAKAVLRAAKSRTAQLKKEMEGALAHASKMEKLVEDLRTEADQRASEQKMITWVIHGYKRQLIDLHEMKSAANAEAAAYLANIPEEMRDLAPEDEHWFLEDRVKHLNASLADVERLRVAVENKGFATSVTSSWIDRRLCNAHHYYLCDGLPLSVRVNLSSEEVGSAQEAGLKAMNDLSKARAEWRREDSRNVTRAQETPAEVMDLLEMEKHVVVTSGALRAFRILHQRVAKRCAGLFLARRIADERVGGCYKLLGTAMAEMEQKQVSHPLYSREQ